MQALLAITRKFYKRWLKAISVSPSSLRHIPDEEIQVFVNAADIVVLPFSRILTSGSAILAMSFCRPVIAPEMGCLTELIEPGIGWLFQPGDLGSLVSALQKATLSDLNEAGWLAYEKVMTFPLTTLQAKPLKHIGVLHD